MANFDGKFKRFRIPNRDVKLTESEAEVTRTQAFQRLFNLKQLGLAHLVYPCAAHTRAGHSIECLDEAAKLLDAVDVSIGSDDWHDVRMAALLHDMGHVPFSHTLEDENEVLPKHDKGDRITNILDRLKKDVGPETQTIIERSAPILHAISSKDDSLHDWKSDLVGNTVCADLLAYITTDAAWTGIEKRPGYYRVYDYFQKVFKKTESDDGSKISRERLCIELTKGGLRTDIVSAILDLLDMRYALTERVIYHHAKAIASAMLARAARLIELKDEPELLTMGDELFLHHINNLASSFPNETTGDGAKMLIEGIRTRNLYKRIFKIQRDKMEDWDRENSRTENDSFCIKWRESSAIEELLSKVEDKHRLKRGSLVLWCPEGKSGMKLVKAHVVWQQSGGLHEPVELNSKAVKQQFPGVHKRVMTIQDQYKDLWTFWVGIHPDLIEEAPNVIDSLSTELGIKCDSVFIKTYLGQNPRFETAAKVHNQVNEALKEYLPDVSRRVTKKAALEADQSPDKSLINETIHELSLEKRNQTNKANQLELDEHTSTDENME